jgi:uncharacterized damage-inducible protein DinB
MEMLEYIKRLFSYDSWANREVLISFETVDAPPERWLKLLGHVLSAEKLWLERLLVEKQTLAVWPAFTIEQCKLEVENLPGSWMSYLTSIGDSGLSQLITYKNTKGESFSSARQDILMHVIMHSAYHRGQIAADMRAAGFTPVLTDFIHAVRQGFME